MNAAQIGVTTTVANPGPMTGNNFIYGQNGQLFTATLALLDPATDSSWTGSTKVTFSYPSAAGTTFTSVQGLLRVFARSCA